MRKSGFWAKVLAQVLAFTLALTLMMPDVPMKAAATVLVDNPVIEKDSSLQAEQKVTYDTVYFGSYPQAEVIATEADMDTIPQEIRGESDYIVDAALYKKLAKATWTKNETIIDGEKYHRLKKEDAVFVVKPNGFVNNYYNWDEGDYHYFKYQPIKWRVLSVSEGKALLLTDMILDCQSYNIVVDVMTWEECTLRTFLNKTFYKAAFTTEQRAAIVSTKLKNEGNTYEVYGVSCEAKGGNDTKDKVFLLSLNDVMEETGVPYGFVPEQEYEDDEAKCAKTTAYAKAMGCVTESETYGTDSYVGNGSYWLRSPGNGSYLASDIGVYGWVYEGRRKLDEGIGVRPAIQVKLSATGLTYAGTVCTDGTVDSVSYVPSEDEAVTEMVDLTAGAKLLSLDAGMKVTYDTVYFGSYPQAEVIAKEADKNSVDPTIRNGVDFIVDAALYKKLKKAKWKNNETVIAGERYCRLSAEDVTCAVLSRDYEHQSYIPFRWQTTYHYFKYQPIKWRVLEISEDEVMLLADMVLDCQKYNEQYKTVTWELCTLRKYLNENFYRTAFTEAEQKAILETELKNSVNPFYFHYSEGGNDTIDKVFLLSDGEISRSTSAKYGFAEYYMARDRARLAKSTTYAKAMGVWSGKRKEFLGNCDYWMRGQGSTANKAMFCWYSGSVDEEYLGIAVDYMKMGIRPAIRVDRSSAEFIYAGTICMDGTIKSAEEAPGLGKQEITLPKVKTYKAANLSKTKASFSLKAGTSGDGTLSYKVTKGSSKYISVSKTGTVTLKKGCPAGSYQVTITASETSRFDSAKKVVTIKVK